MLAFKGLSVARLCPVTPGVGGMIPTSCTEHTTHHTVSTKCDYSLSAGPGSAASLRHGPGSQANTDHHENMAWLPAWLPAWPRGGNTQLARGGNLAIWSRFGGCSCMAHFQCYQ